MDPQMPTTISTSRRTPLTSPRAVRAVAPEKGAGPLPAKAVATVPAPVTPIPVPEPLPVAVASVVPPVEPEEHSDGDVVESLIRKLKGNRPDLMRAATFYEGAKHVYITLAGLPLLNNIAPVVESMTESLINMTPLKPSPEEQAEQKSVAVLDKKICEALSYADEVVDAKKDDTIEGLVSAKKVIHNLGPVQSAVGVACNVGDGVGKAYGSANDTVVSVWQQVWDTAAQTYTGATTMAGNTVNNVTNTAGSAVHHVTTTTGNVVDSAKCTAGDTVGFVVTAVNNTTASIGSTFGWATSSAMSVISVVVAYPIDLFHGIIGSEKKGPAPEE